MRIGRIAALLAIIVSTVGLAPAAQAAEIWTLKSKWDSGCLDHNFTDNVHTRPCNGGPHQKWQVTRRSDGTLSLMNVGTTMCLDNSEHDVRGWGCNPYSYQRWTIKHWTGSEFELVSKYDNHCLDNSVHRVRSWGCLGATNLPYQRWS
jgi:hypothetical protein